MDRHDGRRGRWLVHGGAAVLLLFVVAFATGAIDLSGLGPRRAPNP